MPRLTLTLLAAALLFSTGCKTMDSQTTKQAAALKQAHDAGILTDAEYQAEAAGASWRLLRLRPPAHSGPVAASGKG